MDVFLYPVFFIDDLIFFEICLKIHAGQETVFADCAFQIYDFIQNFFSGFVQIFRSFVHGLEIVGILRTDPVRQSFSERKRQ